MTQLEADEFYNKLKAEGLIDEEIAESYIFSVDLTPEEDIEFKKEFAIHRQLMPKPTEEQLKEVMDLINKIDQKEQMKKKDDAL